MKTIIAVTFFGLLGHTFSADADPTALDSSGCRDAKSISMNGFNADQFFTGTWYLTHLKYRNHSSICPKFDITPKPPTIDYTYGVKGFNNIAFKMHCDGQTKKTGDEYTPFTCKGFFDYTLFMAPVATDYNTFGLVYVCQKAPHVGENIFLFNRQSTTEIPSKAKDELKKKLPEEENSLISVDCKK